MTIKTESEAGICKVVIENDMTIYDVAEQKKQLIKSLKKLKKNELMEIDLSNVNEMDTAGLQVLILLKKTAVKENKIVLLVAHSPASLDVIDHYNLAAYFGDPVIISSASKKK
ncbi:MAG: STAS domain-containing protein [Gammaproteobacteria bacterium]|nr:STAS domain-containing protein [Gammaproteobacteria bacterium]